MSTATHSSIQELVKSGASVGQIRATVDPQCNGQVVAEVGAGFQDGRLTVEAVLAIGGNSIPQWVILMAYAPDESATYCSAYLQNLGYALTPSTLLEAFTDLFPSPAPGTQVATSIGGLVTLADGMPCGFWFDQTVTL